MGNESAIWDADAIDFTAYATYLRDTCMGMWALDSEDGDVVVSLATSSVTHQLQDKKANHLGLDSHASRRNHSC
jgi:hypothetical protein